MKRISSDTAGMKLNPKKDRREMDETLFLMSQPGMVKSIRQGMKESTKKGRQTIDL